MYEQYRDKAAFKEHGQTEHFKALGLGRSSRSWRARERSFYETLE